jgi:hypothetical protein
LVAAAAQVTRQAGYRAETGKAQNNAQLDAACS